MADEDDYVPLAVIATRADVSVRSLREWCATGRLACERIRGAWVLRLGDLGDVQRLAKRAAPPRRPATLVLPMEVSTPEVEQQITCAFGTAAGNVLSTPLIIDEMEYVAFTAEADAAAIEDARIIVERLGGQLLDP